MSGKGHRCCLQITEDKILSAFSGTVESGSCPGICCLARYMVLLTPPVWIPQKSHFPSYILINSFFNFSVAGRAMVWLEAGLSLGQGGEIGVTVLGAGPALCPATCHPLPPTAASGSCTGWFAPAPSGRLWLEVNICFSQRLGRFCFSLGMVWSCVCLNLEELEPGFFLTTPLLYNWDLAYTHKLHWWKSTFLVETGASSHCCCLSGTAVILHFYQITIPSCCKGSGSVIAHWHRGVAG